MWRWLIKCESGVDRHRVGAGGRVDLPRGARGVVYESHKGDPRVRNCDRFGWGRSGGSRGGVSTDRDRLPDQEGEGGRKHQPSQEPRRSRVIRLHACHLGSILSADRPWGRRGNVELSPSQRRDPPADRRVMAAAARTVSEVAADLPEHRAVRDQSIAIVGVERQELWTVHVATVLSDPTVLPARRREVPHGLRQGRPAITKRERGMESHDIARALRFAFPALASPTSFYPGAVSRATAR